MHVTGNHIGDSHVFASDWSPKLPVEKGANLKPQTKAFNLFLLIESNNNIEHFLYELKRLFFLTISLLLFQYLER